MEDEIEKQLLKDMDGKLPEKVCPAHNVLILYLINTNKELKGIKTIVDDINKYITGHEAVEEYVDKATEKTRDNAAEKRQEKQLQNEEIALESGFWNNTRTEISIIVGVGAFCFCLGLAVHLW